MGVAARLSGRRRRGDALARFERPAYERWRDAHFRRDFAHSQPALVQSRRARAVCAHRERLDKVHSRTDFRSTKKKEKERSLNELWSVNMGVVLLSCITVSETTKEGVTCTVPGPRSRATKAQEPSALSERLGGLLRYYSYVA